MKKKTLAHILNPVIVGINSDLYNAQPVTFESMRRAQSYAAGQVDVELYSAQFHEDEELVPAWISKTRTLEKSVLDIGNFQKSRKLPLIKDILDRLFENSQANYFIYTNVDISLMPTFYITVAKLIESGFDALVINRRTIAKAPSSPEQIELMWAQVGKPHPGYDCFIFRREVYPNFDLGTACVGANWIGRVLLSNVIAYSDYLRIFEDIHLTFHLGDDRTWKTHEHLDYDKHNLVELLRILNTFKGKGLFTCKPDLEKMLQDMQRQKDILCNSAPVKQPRRWWHAWRKR